MRRLGFPQGGTRMNDVGEQFYIYIRSSFGEPEKTALYDYIWKNYRRRVAFYISSLVPPQHPYFDDLVQEVLLKVYHNLHTFNPLNSFKAWLYTIARHHCLDFLKARGEKMERAASSDIESLRSQANPETLSYQHEVMDRIDGFIHALDPLDQEISYLRFYENLKYRDIARVVHLNVNTVKWHVHQIKTRLKEHLAG